MQVYSFKYPHYFFEKNKGYPTAEHKIAISRFGLSQIHRKSFKI
jgi:ribonuclease HII